MLRLIALIALVILIYRVRITYKQAIQVLKDFENDFEDLDKDQDED